MISTHRALRLLLRSSISVLIGRLLRLYCGSRHVDEGARVAIARDQKIKEGVSGRRAR
jgi:hypothetical protein